tara:strand:+ start:6728 stop:9808 length:3081 start_codon:yes stop_codon:yes gene_type:complete
MSVVHMEPLAVWGKNSHTKTDGAIRIPGVKEHVVYHVPRRTFRSAASTFGDVRRAESDARYEEISMQLFLRMLHDTANLDEAQAPDIYPYVKAWVEWIPSSVRKDDAVGYNIHAVSLHKDVKFGNALNKLLGENSVIHKESTNRKMNSRKADPLGGLHSYQKWMRVSGKEMYVRTICDRYDGSQEFTSAMDSILHPKKGLNHTDNPANPKHVFTIERSMCRLPRDPLNKDMPHNIDNMFCDPSSYGSPDDGTLTFPSSEHVLLLTPAQLHPKVFCAKYLPDHQNWMERQSAIPQKKLDEDYDPTCETEYDVRTTADIEKARLENMADRSAFNTMAQQCKSRYISDCLELEKTPAFGEAYKKFQEWAVHAMVTQCLDPDACVSEVVSKMLTWRTENPHLATIKHVIMDDSLSVFANRAIALLEQYEQYYLISTTHRMMFLIHHARYDAFRRDFGLHFNCFQAGESACSKSFLFDQMTKMSIPSTVEVLTYQTGKADAVDGNRNDITTVCHEAPPGMFRTAKNPNADSSQEAMFKEKLTSQRVTAKVWCQDEGTGKRSSRLTKSECVGVWMGATNDPPADVEEALKTRFFWGNFEQQRRIGRDIDDCMNGERMMSSADKAQKKKFFRESQEEQYRVMLVEKAIWAKVIKDVDTTASNILIPRLKKKLNKNSIIVPGPRDWERVKVFSRLMAIVTAIETVCNLPGGKNYGLPFTPYMIPDLEEELKVTEEMVIFTISILADQFRSPVEHKILNAIWMMEKANPEFGKPGSDEPNWDYIKLPRLKQLSKRINSRIPIEKGKTSVHNIENFLLNMTKHSIYSKKFKPRAVGAEPSDDKFPVIDNSSSSTKPMSCVMADGCVYVHVQHILAHREDSADSIFRILSEETHANSIEKRIMTACPFNNKCFHVMKVIHRKPGGDQLEYANVLANSAVSRWITRTSNAAAETRVRPGYVIGKDIDRHVADKWSNILGRAVLTPGESMERIVDHESTHYKRPDYRYPDALVGESTVPGKRLHEPEEADHPTKKKRIA